MRSLKSSIGNLQSSMLSLLLAAGMLVALAPRAEATLALGGKVVTYTENTTNFTAHIFSNSVNSTLTTNITFYGDAVVEYLVVAGGGGGGGSHGGGGGAGGFLSARTEIAAGTYAISVGKGGAGGGASPGGAKGDNSSLGIVTTSGVITATGGGGGAGQPSAAAQNNGGSGGGGYGWSDSPAGGTGISGQGYNGGNGSSITDGGGGGGASQTGSNGNSTSGGGKGGDGTNSTFASGVATNYAGGGGGGGEASRAGGAGGLGGGGNGGTNGGTVNMTAGTLGTGGGGGGQRGGSGGNGAAGGSGIVIVRYIAEETGVPAIYNRPVTNVTTTSAYFNGILSSTGSSACAVCVLWGENDGGATWNWEHTNWFNNGQVNAAWTNGTLFSTNLTAADGLAPDKGYYYRFATTNATADAVAPTAKPFITGNVTVEATDPKASLSPWDPTGTFTIRRPPGSTNVPVMVDFTMGGTATENTHYTLSQPSIGTLNLEVGESNKVVTLTLTQLALLQQTAIFRLTLANDNEYPVGAASNATVTIVEAVAKGGRITGYAENGRNFTAHIFTNSVNATLTTNISFTLACTVEYLVVAGGGGGGRTHGGGGGAGGFLTGSSNVAQGTINISVGQGGAGGISTTSAGLPGSNSVFGSVTAIGGGGGKSWASGTGADGGSGGGGCGATATGNGVGGTGTQGGNGGNGKSGTASGAGGGGANATGSSVGADNNGGKGGDGLPSTLLSGTTNYFAGGGGGGGDSSYLGGSGGLGGGGHGGDGGGAANQTAGTLGTGGGGGASRSITGGENGMSGGSGIVIVRYELIPDTTAETLDSIADSDADNKVYGFKTVTYTLTFSGDILDTTVNAGDFTNAAASSPCEFTVGAITETSLGVFTVAVTPTSYGNLQLRVKADAGITDPAENPVSNLPVTDGDTLVVSAMPAPLATGGSWDYYEDGGKDWWSHIFTNSVNADLTTNITFNFEGLVEYLVVAGGGSGGSQHGGGGGAGGMVTGSLQVVKGSTLNIIVGKGGNAMGGMQAGATGNDSVFATTIRAYGGGGGRGHNLAALGNGGSGGGGANGALTPNFSGGVATNGQGYAGGSATSANASGGGGGGAGSVGTNANAIGLGLGHGGIGKQSTFASGVATYYAGGGGGGGDTGCTGGSGGLGGGGNGNLASPSLTAGTPGTGGGGGGDRSTSPGGAAGGSGIVIIRYVKPPPKGTVFMMR